MIGGLIPMKYSNTIHIIKNCSDGLISVYEATDILKCSRASIFRKLKRYREFGETALIHKTYGKPSKKRISDEMRKRIIEIKQKHYYDFNDVHFTEFLEIDWGIKLGRESVRKILRNSGIPPKRKRRGNKYRRMRERKDCFGEMIQIDASIEYWFDGVNEKQTLVAGIDDATGKVYAVFVERESLGGYFALMRQIIKTDGIPMSIYSDRHSIFFTDREPTLQEEIKGIKPLTQFGRAMNELMIIMRKAYSPQAKGRIERSFETFQDRLRAEFRLMGIRSIEEANKYLIGFLKRYNRQFTVKPKSEKVVFKKLGDGVDLDRILCIKEERVVQNDNTISLEGEVIQIPAVEGKYVSYGKKRVDIYRHMDGKIEVWYKGKRVLVIKTRVVKNYCDVAI